MGDWKEYRLDELGFLGRGKSKHRPRNDQSLYGGVYPFFQTGDIKAANCNLTEFTQTYNEKGLAQSKLWEPNTLCITIAANIAENAILKIRGCFPDSVVGFVADPGKADVRFIKYYIDMIKQNMQNISQGTTQDNLSLEKISTFLFKMPVLKVQKDIAGVLSAYDDLIENNLHRIKILEEMARSLYREWFVYFRYPGHESIPLVNSPLGPIPKGWEVNSFTDMADVLSGGTPKTDINDYWNGNIPFFTPRDANDCFYVMDTEKHLTELGLSKCNSHLYPPDTVFITARGTVGKIVLSSEPMAMNQSCYALKGKNEFSQLFIFLLTMQQIEHLKKNASGATFDAIVVDTFNRMNVVCPLGILTAKFTNLAIPLFSQIRNIQKQNKNLRRTRDLLLPRLLSGQISFDGKVSVA